MSIPEGAPGPLRRKDGDPVFDEPWQAQTLAMADSLVGSGVISSTDRARVLGAELRRAYAKGAPDDAESYYRAVLAALEHLLDECGAIPHQIGRAHV